MYVLMYEKVALSLRVAVLLYTTRAQRVNPRLRVFDLKFTHEHAAGDSAGKYIMPTDGRPICSSAPSEH